MVNETRTLPQRDVATRQKIHAAVGGERRFLPTQLAIETVRACNAKCIMCPSETMQRPKGVMDPGLHQRILDKVKAWGAPIGLITHAGLGEPLLDKKLEDRIRAEKRAFPDAQIAVYSNGALLTEERAQSLLDAGLDILSVSINGFRESTYEAVMKIPRQPTFENVERFLQLKSARGAATQLHVSIVQTELCSDEEVQEFRDYWQGRADAVVTPQWISWGGDFDGSPDGGAPSVEPEQFPCSYIWKTLQVDFDGTVKMCCEDYDSKYPMGNLDTQDPDEIFNSPRMQAQRSAQLTGDFSCPEICEGCTESHGVARQFWQDPQLVPASTEGDAVAREFQNAIPSLPAPAFKQVLGHMLSHGLQANQFDFPAGVWPPPTPARAYIEAFLKHYAEHIHGRVVEFDPPVYKPWLERLPQVTGYDVWNTEPGDGVTVVGDLRDAPQLPDGSFDTILCTHVLSAIPDLASAARELHRLLAPGGLLLVTVPAVLQKYAPHPGDYWRFTQDSLRTLLQGFRDVRLHPFGNAATVAGSPFYLMVEDFPPEVLQQQDPECPSVLAAAAWK